MQPANIGQPQSCVKCGAPVGTSGGRCPFCGTEQPKLPSMRPSDIATVGLSDINRASMGRPPIRRQQKSNAGTVVAIAASAVLFIAGTAAFLLLRGGAPAATPPAASATAVEAIRPAPQVALTTMGGLPVTDATKVDPTDYLPRARRQVALWDKDAKLVEINVTAAKSGWVNVAQPGGAVVMRYMKITKDPRVKANDTTHEDMVFTLKTGGPDAPEKLPGDKADRGVNEPTCVWSAAWRAAVASGMPTDQPVDARFGAVPKRDEGSWVFTAGGVTRQLSGTSCAVETK